MKKPFKHIPIIVFLAFIFLMPATGLAYYQVDNKSEKNHFLLKRYTNSWTKEKKAFVVYDNLDNFSLELNHNQILYPESDTFVPADIIDSNFPISIFIQSHVTIENSAAHFVNANLKIKKLLKEYEEVQKRSRALMKDLDVPFLDFTPPFLEYAVNKPSVHKDTKRLNQEVSDINVLSHTSVSSNRSVYHANRSLTPSFSHYQKKNFQPVSPSSRSSTSRSSNYSDSVDSHDRYEEKNLPRYSQQMKTHYDEDTKLPWFFRFLFKIIPYLISHKFESAMLGLFIFTVISFISSIMSRK